VLGLRVSELVAAPVTDLGHERGHRVLTITRKGGARQRLAIPPAVAELVDHALPLPDGTLRTTRPLVATATGPGWTAAPCTALSSASPPRRGSRPPTSGRTPCAAPQPPCSRPHRQAAALGYRSATLLPDPTDDKDLVDKDLVDADVAEDLVYEQLARVLAASAAEPPDTAQAADVIDED
jgi:hypothetical protein